MNVLLRNLQNQLINDNSSNDAVGLGITFNHLTSTTYAEEILINKYDPQISISLRIMYTCFSNHMSYDSFVTIIKESLNLGLINLNLIKIQSLLSMIRKYSDLNSIIILIDEFLSLKQNLMSFLSYR